MKRRDLLIALAASITPVDALSQAERAPARIGPLSLQSRETYEMLAFVRAFREGMRELGYVEGRSYVIEQRNADGSRERLETLAGDLVASRVSVIVASGESGRAAAKATRTIPVVIPGVSDPVAEGWAATLARPGANITGLVTSAAETNAKQLELVTSAIRKLTRVIVLMTNVPAHARQLNELQTIAQKTNLQTVALRVNSAEEIDRAMSSLAAQPGSALIVLRGSFTNLYAARIAALALKLRLASISSSDFYAEAGGLMSYGDDSVDRYRRSASFVDKILKGVRPGDIPFELPTRFRLAVNSKTAKALGLSIPQELLLRADKVFE